MVFCPRCQADNRAGALFCGECGARIETLCPACGASVVATYKFCDSCGAALGAAAAGVPTPARFASPERYTPAHLAERILGGKQALEGERKQVTVLLADLKGSLELLADRDPEEAREVLDPVLERMIEAVHRYEGTVNQIMGDGIMALFGAPLAHEDHALRACFAALAMQSAVRKLDERPGEPGRTRPGVQIRVGINSGEVVVRAISNDLHMDYSAVGQTTHMAGRMEQIASPGAILMTSDTLRLVEGFVEVRALGPTPIRGLTAPVEVFELLGSGPTRTRLQAAAARGLTRFVGREIELDRLEQSQQLARAGHGQVVALVGEPGVGKSRLLWEFIRSPHCRGWLVVESRSVSYGKATSYLPVIDLLKSYFQVEDRDEPRKIAEKVTGKLLALDETLAAAAPAVLSLLGVPVTDPAWEALDPPQRRQRTLDAVKHLLLRESRIQPLLIVFEDLHWIDSETQALLDNLVDSLPATRLLLLVNYRPSYQHGWAGKTYYNQLQINLLSPASAEALLASLLGSDPALDPLKQLLIARTEGNPLFLEESVRTLVETQVLLGERGGYRLGKELPAIQVPATVQAILAARLDRLDPVEKSLLQTAAVIGKDVPFALLEAVADVPEQALHQGLARLRGAEFLYETIMFPEPEYTFKHALSHEVAYGSLLQERRRILHGRIVDAIERLYPDRLVDQSERLAAHALRGEVWDKAVTYLRAAGGRAMAHSANREAVGFFEQALEALRHAPESRRTLEQAIDLRFDLRNALFALGTLAPIADHLHLAAGLAEALGDRRRLGWVAAYMCHYYWRVGDLVRAIESGQRALTIADELQDVSLHTTNNALGLAYYTVGDYPRAIECLRKTMTILQGDHARGRFGWAGVPAVISRAYLVGCQSELGEFAEGASLGDEAIRLAEVAEHPFSLGQAYISVGILHIRWGQLARATPVLERALTLSRVSDVAALFPGVASALGYAYVLLGRAGEGIPLLEQAIAHAASRQIRARQSLWDTWLSEAYLLAGQPARALEIAQRAIGLSRELGALGNEAYALRITAEIRARAARPDLDEAESAYRRAIGLAEALAMRPLLGHARLGLARLYARAGRAREARAERAAAVSIFQALGMTAALDVAEADARLDPAPR
ncbi:MAG: AAA family ATPase [Candidatus Rokuibacteriota bacterium]